MIAGEITVEDVLALLDLLERNGIEVTVDGGWCVDALLGRQTRPHLDLDIAIPARDRRAIRECLTAAGFVETETPDRWEHNFVMQDDRLRRVDVHSYVLDERGNNAGGVAYEGRHLTGTGTIGGRPVRCVPVDVLIEFHLGYELDAGDYADVLALCRAFDRPLPVEYEQFRAQDP
jgi:lincosamide nucleotidyltransferase A/C/D/E